MGHALIVEDDPDVAETMAALIAAEGFTAVTARTLKDARRQLATRAPDLVLLDLQLPDGQGLDLLKDTDQLANTEVVLVTGHASIETSIQALRLGVADYLVKPFNIKQLQGILSRLMQPSTLKAELEDLRAELDRTGRFGHMVGRSAPMRQVYEQIARVAGSAVTVLITGESGSGKEVAARTIHDLSRRRHQPFLAVNCGAISPHLIESEIFGHEKGSFTGADRQHLGFFERAHGGTLFLDEVTEMPPELQVKLLRVLETGSFMRVGSTTPVETDVRVIAATNRVPTEAVASGKLREDLMYRLDVFPIRMPSLHERPDDIPMLAEHFLQDIGRREGVNKRFLPTAIAALCRHRWQGNVRDLRNAVQRIYLMADGRDIDDEWLQPGLGAGTKARPPTVTVDDPDTLTVRIGQPLAEIERAVILATLKRFDHHKERTAAALGVSLKTLYNRLKEYAEK
ncbi:MAG: sigma-54-dependent transcriptional regulator [Aquincola tertiaricarbonis]|uniref:sigma-54-dependent transcriptional regulator n=1 Tax=Aquincola TaxID=391952 RepID=UPI0006152DE8|nr:MULTISPECIES: sigma-54 dependent transcriptional regulator [Aquincola]MCR5866837.1 sigma-54 dependent transcriptional regulator [Aquincola sp. J276]